MSTGKGDGMTEAEALDALIEAGTALLGIDADPAWQEQIRLHLRISLDHARNVASFPLPDETDPAPVFHA